MRTFWLAALALLSSGCISVTSGSSKSQNVYWADRLPRDKSGMMLCNSRNQPLAVLSRKMMPASADSISGPEGAHELRHVRQVRSSRGGCLWFVLKYILNPSFRFDAEVDATCAEIAHSYRDGEGWDNLLKARSYSLIKHYYLSRSLNPEKVRNRLDSQCRPEVDLALANRP